MLHTNNISMATRLWATLTVLLYAYKQQLLVDITSIWWQHFELHVNCMIDIFLVWESMILRNCHSLFKPYDIYHIKIQYCTEMLDWPWHNMRVPGQWTNPCCVTRHWPYSLLSGNIPQLANMYRFYIHFVPQTV